MEECGIESGDGNEASAWLNDVWVVCSRRVNRNVPKTWGWCLDCTINSIAFPPGLRINNNNCI